MEFGLIKYPYILTFHGGSLDFVIEITQIQR